LKGLSELGRLNNKTYADLLSDPELENDRAAFENSSVRTVVIRNWQDEAYLYEVFLRINTGSVQLSPQELRQALHPGPFSKFVDDASADSELLQAALKLKAPDFRMRDAEILLRFIAYRNYILDYNGNLKRFLDETTKRLNEQWPSCEGEVRGQVEEMDNAIEFTRSVFSEAHYLRKWNGEKFEARKNRAVFDIMLHYFSRPDVRAGLSGKYEIVVERFKNLCEDNPDFRASLETTTKSMVSNKTRFNVWGAVISDLSGIPLNDMKFAE
jgi:hypothetical protein